MAPGPGSSTLPPSEAAPSLSAEERFRALLPGSLGQKTQEADPHSAIRPDIMVTTGRDPSFEQLRAYGFQSDMLPDELRLKSDWRSAVEEVFAVAVSLLASGGYALFTEGVAGNLGLLVGAALALLFGMAARIAFNNNMLRLSIDGISAGDENGKPFAWEHVTGITVTRNFGLFNAIQITRELPEPELEGGEDEAKEGSATGIGSLLSGIDWTGERTEEMRVRVQYGFLTVEETEQIIRAYHQKALVRMAASDRRITPGL